MYNIEDNAIHATRGDIVPLVVTAKDDGVPFHFQPGDVLRIKVFDKKGCENVVLQKDFPVFANAERVTIHLSEEDTKIGEVISKPKDYWYEIELNPLTDPQTIIGYFEDGPALFRLYPEGADIPEIVPTDPEDIPLVDEALDMTSSRPIANKAVALEIEKIKRDSKKTYVTPQMYGAVGDGVADDTKAIQDAFDSVKDYGSIYFPPGAYRINGRVKLQNVSNVDIVNSGLLMPVDGVVPMIGTLSLYNVKNANITNLKMDGNLANVPETTTVGMQSLIDIKNCENIEFVNLDIRNTSESGITGASNNNVTINNAVFENIGEHCVYFGGAACHGMTFNNFKVKNIGQNGMSTPRVTAVVKFRLHEVSDEVHTGIKINGVEFTDETLLDDVAYSCYHALASLSDVKDFVIENCTIKGETTAIVQVNAVTDSGVVRNVVMDGRDISAGVGIRYGTNDPTEIENFGAFQISLYDCVLKCSTNMLAAYDLYNCDIQCTNYLTSSYVPEGLIDRHIIDGCRIDVGSLYRMNFQNASKVEIRNTEFVSSGGNANQPVLYASADIDLVLINCIDNTDRPKFIADNDRTVNLIAEGCTFVGKINDVTTLNLSNCKVSYATYINHDSAVFSHITRIGENKRLDITKHTVKQYGDNASCDLRFSMIKKVTEKDLIIIPTPKVNFTVSISDNIVTIAGEKGDNVAISYDVIVF